MADGAQLVAGCAHVHQGTVACRACGNFQRGCMTCQLCLDDVARLITRAPEAPAPAPRPTVDAPLHPLGQAPGDRFGGGPLP